jgi:hypothetical protein
MFNQAPMDNPCEWFNARFAVYARNFPSVTTNHDAASRTEQSLGDCLLTALLIAS